MVVWAIVTKGLLMAAFFLYGLCNKTTPCVQTYHTLWIGRVVGRWLGFRHFLLERRHLGARSVAAGHYCAPVWRDTKGITQQASPVGVTNKRCNIYQINYWSKTDWSETSAMRLAHLRHARAHWLKKGSL